MAVLPIAAARTTREGTWKHAVFRVGDHGTSKGGSTKLTAACNGCGCASTPGYDRQGNHKDNGHDHGNREGIDEVIGTNKQLCHTYRTLSTTGNRLNQFQKTSPPSVGLIVIHYYLAFAICVNHHQRRIVIMIMIMIINVYLLLPVLVRSQLWTS